jgi:hypothetical protein
MPHPSRPLPRMTSRPIVLAPCIAFGHHLRQDRNAFGASFNPHRSANLQHRHNLFRRCPRFQRALNVPSHTGRVHVGTRRVEGDADQLHKFRGEYTALVGAGSKRKKLIRPRRRKLEERIPRRIPLPDRAHRIARWSRRLRSSRRLHSRRLHLLQKDGRSQAAGMDRQPNATFQH